MGKKKDKKAKASSEASALADLYGKWARAIADDYRQSAHAVQQQHDYFMIELLFDRGSAQAFVAAVNYMDADDTLVENNEEACETAHRFFHKVARTAAALFEVGLGQEGVPTNPEVWLQGYQNVATYMDAQDAAEFGETEDDE